MPQKKIVALLQQIREAQLALVAAEAGRVKAQARLFELNADLQELMLLGNPSASAPAPAITDPAPGQLVTTQPPVQATIASPQEHIEAAFAKAENAKAVPAKEVTLDDVRAVCVKAGAAGKSADVKQLLANYGVARVSEIKPDKYAAFIAAVEGL